MRILPIHVSHICTCVETIDKHKKAKINVFEREACTWYLPYHESKMS